jgi:hypothetical protein
VQGCGYAEEVGKGAGRGFNVNVPWTSKGMGDADYLAAFDLLLDPIIAQFDPQVRALILLFVLSNCAGACWQVHCGLAGYLAAFDLVLGPIIGQFDLQVRALGCHVTIMSCWPCRALTCCMRVSAASSR